MRRITLLCAVLATCTGLNAFDASAQVTIRGPVEMRSDRSLAEIAEYVDEVAQRLERGLYDEIEAQSLAWLEAETASLRGEVNARSRAPDSPRNSGAGPAATSWASSLSTKAACFVAASAAPARACARTAVTRTCAWSRSASVPGTRCAGCGGLR